jgi:hypothetical protein
VISCGPGADVAILELRRRDRGRHRGRRHRATASGSAATRHGPAPTSRRGTANRSGLAFPIAGVTAATCTSGLAPSSSSSSC